MSITVEHQTVEFMGQYQDYAPPNADRLSYSDYSIMRKYSGRFVKKAQTWRFEGFRCPNCETVSEQNMEHGSLAVCECGIVMQLFGNSLACWA